MNRSLIILSIIILALLTTYLIKENIGDTPLYKNISLDEYKNKITNKETFYIYIYSPQCPACKKSMSVVNGFIKKYKIEMLAVNTSEKENKDSKFFSNNKIEYIPTLIYYKNGAEYSRLVGTISQKDIEEFFKSNNKN